MMRLCVILLVSVYVGQAQITENNVNVAVTQPVDLPIAGVSLDQQRTEIMNRMTLITNVVLTKLTKLFKKVLKTETGSKTLEHIYAEIHAIAVDKGFSQVIRSVSNEIKEVIRDPVTPQIFASLLDTVYKLYMLDDESSTHLHYLLTDIHDIMRSRHNLEKAYQIVHTGCSDIINDNEKREIVTILLNGLSEHRRPGSPPIDLTKFSKEISIEADPNGTAISE